WRRLGDFALELWIQQVVPLPGRGDPETLGLFRVVDQAVRLERGADPVALRVLERNGLRLAEAGGDGGPGLVRDLDLLQQLLLGELLEQRRLAAPEDVDLGFAFPFNDAAVRDRGARRDRVYLHRQVPLFLRVLREGLKRRVVDELRHRRDDV